MCDHSRIQTLKEKLTSEQFERVDQAIDRARMGQSCWWVEIASLISVVDNIQRVALWLLSKDTGASSKQLAFTFMVGEVQKGRIDFPRDAHDLGRCIRLIESVPEVATALPLLAESCRGWRALFHQWSWLTTKYNILRGCARQYEVITSAMQNMVEGQPPDVEKAR